MGKKIKRGKLGNAAQYMTRNQAIKKLQLRLSDFRRLCILKGIHPREPKKKVHGANKTYYHAKDINWLLHEPLLNTFRSIKAYDRKVRRARAKHNQALAKRLMQLKPTYRLDHLIRERYPSFIDALRDLDDPLTLVHLFATLPAESKYQIPSQAVAKSRRLAMEWQAYVVRANALRRVFVSVKGFYYEAEILGQSVTWLVPHALSQVLPQDVDFKVMLTFLEFYNTLLQFVNFKLYHMLELKYPPTLDSKLEEAAAGLVAVMQDLAGLQGQADKDRAAEQQQPQVEGGEAGKAGVPSEEAKQRIASLQGRLREIVGQEDEEEGGHAEEEEEEEVDSEEDGGPVLFVDSEGEDDDGDDDDEGAAAAAAESDDDLMRAGRPGAADDDEDDDDDDTAREARLASGSAAGASGRGLDADAGARAAGGAQGPDVDINDEASVCGSLFRGLVFFLAREVPREPLMLVIRAFGGVAAWDGQGSPHDENSEAITHQVVDRPTQGHRFLAREYVQPQWVFDSANFRVLMPSELYAPGKPPPPHLSPFVNDEEEGYTPEFALRVQRLQEAARAARLRASGRSDPDRFIGEAADVDGEEADGDAVGAKGGSSEDAAVAEKRYAAELAKELRQANKKQKREGSDGDGEEEEEDEEDDEEGTDGAEEDDSEEGSDSEEADDEEPAAGKKRKQAAAGGKNKKQAKKQHGGDGDGDFKDDEAALKDIMMSRKTRKVYERIQRARQGKRERVEQLERKAAAIKKGGKGKQ